MQRYDNILDAYVREAPSSAAALRIFEGEWSSRLPDPFGEGSGPIPLFQDSRIIWGTELLGGIAGFRVLELGPLEAGHTTMLETLGADSVTAVEGNTRAFLKCLIVKELLGLTRSKFLLGDITEFLRVDASTYDLVVASGVLYHLVDPMEALSRIADRTSRLLLWTHYYDAGIIATNEASRQRFSGAESRVTPSGFAYTAHRHEYAESLTTPGFCGGANDHSFHLEREDILSYLKHLGFTKLDIGFESRDAAPFPAFTVLAQKSESSS